MEVTNGRATGEVSAILLRLNSHPFWRARPATDSWETVGRIIEHLSGEDMTISLHLTEGVLGRGVTWLALRIKEPRYGSRGFERRFAGLTKIDAVGMLWLDLYPATVDHLGDTDPLFSALGELTDRVKNSND